jgi:hypothetical protein
LKIGNSRLRLALCGALSLVTACALLDISVRGYTWLALLLTPLVISLLWRLRRDPMEGAELCWCLGHWTLERHAQQRIITLGPRRAITPWVIYATFSDLSEGPGGRLWLFVDCAPDRQWRQLRVRMTLLH